MSREDLGDVLGAVPSLMRNFPAIWCVAGGWAIDLYLGRVTRPHGDVELAVFRQDQALLHRQFPDWTFRKVVAAQFSQWRADEYLSLPVHEIHARSNNGPPLALEFLLNERIAGEWVFRRDSNVRLPLDRAVRVGDGGYPILNPAIVLLFKAKSPRARDVSDFQSVRHALDPEDRDWLRAALQRCHPGHSWLPMLDFN
jgi:hypothetical protein